MKKMMPFLFSIVLSFFGFEQVNAFVVHKSYIQNQENGQLISRKSKKESVKIVKELSKKDNKIKKKIEKIALRDAINDVFGERYFLMGAIFVLGGFVSLISATVFSFGLLGWIVGIGPIIGLALIVLAILQIP